MAGILNGLRSLGLEDLEKANLYEDGQNKTAPNKAEKAEKKSLIVEEKDLIYDKSFCCPICDNKFSSKVMKTGKTRAISSDLDSRALYAGIDPAKYEVAECPECGYATLVSQFHPLLNAQVKMIKEGICNKIRISIPTGDVYSYEDVIPRYQVALACAITKRARDSEKASICLHFAWLLRGYAEFLEEQNPDNVTKIAELREQEKECLEKALDGFINARQKESLPICGMDQVTLDYEIAAMAYMLGKDNIAAKLVSEILVSPVVSSRLKDKTRTLKEMILKRYRK